MTPETRRRLRVEIARILERRGGEYDTSEAEDLLMNVIIRYTNNRSLDEALNSGDGTYRP